MSATETAVKPAVKKSVKDAQTGKDFDVIPEGNIDVICAWISAAYSLAVIGFMLWLVLKMLYGQPAGDTLAARLLPILSGSTSKLIFYTAVGGAIGASVNNLRSFITWHAEERAFGWRFIWKYIAMPPLGGTLAVLVYGILQGGMAVFTGGTAPDGNNGITSLSAWATGTLAGYGSHKVFKWLDDKVNSLFKVEPKIAVVPDVKGATLEEAKKMVTNSQLAVGTISETPASTDQVGKVIAQTPEAGTQIDCGSRVDLTVGIAASGATNLQPEDTIPHNGKPTTVGETAVAAATATVVGTDMSVNTAEANPSDDIKEDS